MRLGRKLAVLAIFVYIMFYPLSPDSEVSSHLVSETSVNSNTIGGTSPCDDDNRSPSILCPGDIAPDIIVAALEPGAGNVTLSSFRGDRPVVLVFGSRTCRQFREVLPFVRKLYMDWHGSVHFVLVSLAEAYPSGAFPTTTVEEKRLLDPRERWLPTVVDDAEGNTATAYSVVGDICSRVVLVDWGGIILDMDSPAPPAAASDDPMSGIHKLLCKGAWPVFLSTTHRKGC